MEKVFDWSAPIVNASARMAENFISYLPQLLAGLTILFFGWLVAKALRAVAIKIVKSVDRLSNVPLIGAVAAGRIDDSMSRIIGNTVYWLVILFFVTSATNLLGLKMFAGWLDGLIGHLPSILSGILIIIAGVVIGTLVHDAIDSTAKAMPDRPRALLARGGQLFTLATLIVIGIDQIGIDITVLIMVVGIAVGALLGGVAIAFGLGSRTLVSNLIAARYLGRDYRAGERIRVDGMEGTILEITPVAVILDTDEGRMTVPAKIFGEQASIMLTREQTDAG